ncbi:hypothetical protein G7Y89_g13934 [Cudoniella acicularis]|uniref:ER membrane protein complex subunit 1 n=1 Tax=Cudoniella acicularis TaxID=354080 RepID=A0A8H4VXR8_9HELO|nr:hypothetical protein G7Y89_g13934 [Cudoniella acicularis]
MRLPINLLCLALSILPSTRAVYSDEAYSVDYHHELLGLPQPQTTFFHRPRKDDKATLLYTLSDLGVLGAVNPGSGKVVWRQLLGDGISDGGFLRPVQGENTVVSALTNRVDAWDAMNLEVMETAAGAAEAKDVLALFEEDGKAVLRRLSGTSGDVVWEHKDSSTDVPLQVSTNVKDVFVVCLHGATGAYNLKVTTLDPVTGKRANEYILSTKTDVHAPEDTGDIQTLPLKESDGNLLKVALHVPTLVQSQPHFLVHSHSSTSNRADVYHIDLASGSIKKAYELPKLPGQGAISTSFGDANVYFTRITQDEVIIVSSASHGILGRWPLKLESSHGSSLHGASEVVQRTPDTYAVRSAMLTSNQDWVLIRNGAEGWVRPEGLSGAVAAEWAELPESESLAKNLEVEAESNPVSAYIHRVKRHVNDLQYLPEYLQNLPLRFLSSILPGEAPAPNAGVLIRDSFGFNKLVIVATQRGRVYGLDVGNQGRIIWSAAAFEQAAGKKWDVKGIWVEHSKGHTTVRGSDGEYILLNTTSGTKIESMPPGSWPTVRSTAVVDSASGKWVLPIGVDGNPGEVPSAWAPKDSLVVQGDHGEVKGLKFETEGANAYPVVTWTFTPPLEQRIIRVISRPTHDPVASIGRVLGDRTVLYKYLNPNIILVTAVSDAASTASFYLLDTVSGDLLYSTSHEGYQIVTSEMYESVIPNDRGPLGYMSNSSSLEPTDIPNAEPALPHVITQTYLVPGAISHMSVTSTRQGITTRQLLCTIASSNAIIGIPRTLLDPRRPVGRDPTPGEMEEGLFRYQPVIEFDPKLVLTHKREVIGVKDVIASPAVLESTSLLFAYGIDIFGTRVAPSAAFDILGKGFNKLSLVGTVLALWGSEETNQWEVDDILDI